MRIKRTIDIAMSNYDGIIGAAVFSYEGHLAYASENMEITTQDIETILAAWNGDLSEFIVKHTSFISAMADKNGFVAINPDGAVSLICATGNGVWFVAAFAPMDQDKSGILRECVQAAKLLEASLSVFDV